jgi:hypothetical protein
MKFLLQQETDFSCLLTNVQAKDQQNQEYIRKFIKDDHSNMLMADNDFEGQLCLEEFENLQRIACQRLLEKRDVELIRLRHNEEEIKRELQVYFFSLSKVS